MVVITLVTIDNHVGDEIGDQHDDDVGDFRQWWWWWGDGDTDDQDRGVDIITTTKAVLMTSVITMVVVIMLTTTTKVTTQSMILLSAVGDHNVNYDDSYKNQGDGDDIDDHFGGCD